MSAKWKRSDGLVWEELGDETLVVDPRSGARWSLNALASAVWKLCDGLRSADELAAVLAKLSGRSLRALREELMALCSGLAGAGLLSAESGTTMLARNIEYNLLPMFRPLGLASGPRRRPSPRGNSGPG
ncbi:MAG TPA: PqqD family protein [Planctomycetota bacterium]|nr:PqqD family protein [Planctomycetota bacterium]